MNGPIRRRVDAANLTLEETQMNTGVPIEINGEEKKLRFDVNAVSDIEEYFGKGIGVIFSEDQVGFRTIRAFYWAGLKWRDRGLTIERAGKFVQALLDQGETIETMMKPVIKALELSGVMGKEELNELDEYDEGEAKNVKQA